MEAQFNDLCRRMLQFDRPEEPPEVLQEEKSDASDKLSRRERRENERRERKKERKEKASNKKPSIHSRLEEARLEHRLSQFEESDKKRIEKILFNK